MSVTSYRLSVNQHPNINRTRICPHCLEEYELGLTGILSGCDTCEGVVRLPNGMIDMNAYTETFINQMTGEEIPA